MLLEADLTQACAALRELYDADLCSCLLLDPASDELVVVAAAGPRAAAMRRRRIPAWLGVVGEAFQTGLPVAVP